MEAQAGHDAQTAARPAREAAAKRASRILDDRQRPERVTNLLSACRISKLIDDDRRAGLAASLSAQRVGRAVPFVLIDVDEAYFGSCDANRMCGARPTQRGAEHLVARANLQGLERKLQGRGTARGCYGVPAAKQCSDRLLELLHQRSLHQVSRLENGGDGASLVFADPWFC